MHLLKRSYSKKIAVTALESIKHKDPKLLKQRQQNQFIQNQQSIIKEFIKESHHNDSISTTASTTPLLQLKHKNSFRILIIGRPNVGKSTLFNKLAGRYHAIVHNIAGVTRDCQETTFDVKYDLIKREMPCTIVDTPGADTIEQLIIQLENSKQIQNSNLILFVSDARDGITDWDIKIANHLRRYSTIIPIIHVQNKCDLISTEEVEVDPLLSWLGNSISISAEQELHFSNLFSSIKFVHWKWLFTTTTLNEKELETIRICLLGKTNVGKSTLINQLLGNPYQLVTSPIENTTRDSIELECQYNDKYNITICDTAGIRSTFHKLASENALRVDQDLKKIQIASMKDTLRSIQYSNVVCFLIDSQKNEKLKQGLTREELDMISQVEKEGRALVLIANKWDVVREPEHMAMDLEARISSSLSQLKGLKVIVMSAKHGIHCDKMLEQVVEQYEKWNSRIHTSRLNQFIQQYFVTMGTATNQSRQFPKILYMTQTDVRPPTFCVFVQSRIPITNSFTRFLVNALRNEFQLQGIPIRVRIKLKSKKRP